MTSLKKSVDVSKWVDLYSDYLFNYCIVRVNDTEIAKDLVQDTFIAGIKGMEKFEGKSTTKTWLTSILKRKIIDHWRRKKIQQTDVVSSIFEKENSHFWNKNNNSSNLITDVEAKLNNEDLSNVLQDCISLLPIKWRIIFIDKMIDQKDSKEVCKINNITERNFWVIIHRSKMKLRECLNKKGVL